MSRAVNENGKCIICNYYSYDICWNCDMFVCEEHRLLIPFNEPAIRAKIFCPRCVK